MDRRIHQRALRAASRVAWLSLATGCGGITEGTNELGDGSLDGGTSATTGIAGSDELSDAVGATSTSAASGTSTRGPAAADGISAAGGSATMQELEASATGSRQPPPAVDSCSAEEDVGLLTCCNELLAPFVKDSFIVGVEAARSEAEVVACCTKLTALPAIPGQSFADIAGCCEVVGHPAGICTPWGPAVPPEFRLMRAIA